MLKCEFVHIGNVPNACAVSSRRRANDTGPMMLREHADEEDCHYNPQYRPSSVFHFDTSWICASSCSIEECNTNRTVDDARMSTVRAEDVL